MCEMCGYKNGDGIFAPGGSISNMYGLSLARYKLCPDVKTKGIFGMKPLVLYTSEESHYSFKKDAHWLGIGTENCIAVKTNEKGQMLASDLEEKIRTTLRVDKQPFFVNATAGTTVLGLHIFLIIYPLLPTSSSLKKVKTTFFNKIIKNIYRDLLIKINFHFYSN